MEFTGERFIPEKLKETDETYQEHVERYRFALSYLEGQTILDVACGSGYGSHMLSKVAKRVYGIDISPEAVAYAKEKYSKDNIRFEVMDTRKLGYPDGFFDAVVSFETIEHVEDPELFLKEIKRVLKPGGLLILSTPNVETAPGGGLVHVPFHVREFTLGEMTAMLQSFRDIAVYSQKMTYHRRSYKKIRLFSRHIYKPLRDAWVSGWLKNFSSGTIPIFFKILVYEYAYKFKVVPFTEKNKFIKPTFFVLTCCS